MGFRSSRHRPGIVAMTIVTAIVLLNSNIARGDDSYLADTGFRPAQNGFPFQNYGNENNPQNLSAPEMRKLFGDQVCGQAPDADGNCQLNPQAQEWMDKTNKGMGGGHCDGMATLSSLIYDKKVDTANLGGDSASAMKYDGNTALQHQIALWFATQFTTPTQPSEIKVSPTEIIDQYIAATTAKKDTYTVGIYQPDGSQGHSVTPYAVVDKGNGINWLMIYDNNFPGEERHIEVDRNANTWTYFTASNPNEPGNGYKGDANTRTLTLTADSVRLQDRQCPFCQQVAAMGGGLHSAGLVAPAADNREIWLSDSEKPDSFLHLLIVDDQGHKLGYDQGKLVSEIPGASYMRAKSADLSQNRIEPVYIVPSSVNITITLDGSALKREEAADVTVIAPGYDLGIENIKVQPGEKDVMTVAAGNKQFSYKPSGLESPDIIYGVTHTGSDYEFVISGFEMDSGATMSANLDYDGGVLGIKTDNKTQTATFGLAVTRIDETKTRVFNHNNIDLAPGSAATIDFGKWDGQGDLPLEIGGKTVSEANTPK